MHIWPTNVGSFQTHESLIRRIPWHGAAFDLEIRSSTSNVAPQRDLASAASGLSVLTPETACHHNIHRTNDTAVSDVNWKPGVWWSGDAGVSVSPLFSTGVTHPPFPPLFGLKFVQKLVHCCNWLLTETQCKIISVQHVCRPKLS